MGKPNLFYRSFNSVADQNIAIWENFINSNFKDGDELWHLGDVCYSVLAENSDDNLYGLKIIRKRYPNSKFNLIVGNYDEDKLDILSKYFDNIAKDGYVHLDSTVKGIYLNHYPVKCKKEVTRLIGGNVPAWDFGITGHIHGLWKVQKNMINVGVDAWHFKPVSEDEIKFAMIACQQYYDENVFPYKN